MAVARESKVAPHQFDPDPDLGWEQWVPLAQRGRPRRRYCRHCGLLGEPGDARHRYALPPVPPDPAFLAASVARDRAVLGETEEDDG